MPDALQEQSRDTAVPGTGTSRELVPLALGAAAPVGRPCAFRADARFVAHLIATATHAPQTRTHRRVAPDDVTTTYSGVSARGGLLVAASGFTLTLVA